MEWTEVASLILTTVVVPAIGLFMAWFKVFLNNKNEEIKSKMEREHFNYYLDVVSDLIYTCVWEVEGVFVDLLEKDGLFDKEAQVKALEMVKKKVLAQLTLQAKEVLEKTYVDYIAYIESKIEQIVEKM